MKKILTALVLVIGLTASVSAVTVEDISLEPDNIRYNDTVNVTAYVDGEDEDIASIDVDVRENSDLIVEDELLDYLNGDEQGLSSWKDTETFTTPTDDNETVEYDVRVQAIDSEGNQADKLLIAEIRPDETVIEELDTEDNDSDEIAFGLSLIEIVTGFAVIIFIWALFKD